MLVYLTDAIINKGGIIPEELPISINERAVEVATELEELAAEIFMLAKYTDEPTGMRLENAIAKLAKAGLVLEKYRRDGYIID